MFSLNGRFRSETSGIRPLKRKFMAFTIIANITQESIMLLRRCERVNCWSINRRIPFVVNVVYLEIINGKFLLSWLRKKRVKSIVQCGEPAGKLIFRTWHEAEVGVRVVLVLRQILIIVVWSHAVPHPPLHPLPPYSQPIAQYIK